MVTIILLGVLVAAMVGVLAEFHVYHRRTVSRLLEDQRETLRSWGSDISRLFTEFGPAAYPEAGAPVGPYVSDIAGPPEPPPQLVDRQFVTGKVEFHDEDDFLADNSLGA